MKNILNEINNSIKFLIQQNKEIIKNSFVQTGENSQQIQTQNNFCFYNIVKPLKLDNKNNTFRVYKNIVNKTDVIYSSVSFFILGTVFSKFIVGLNLGIEFFAIVSIFMLINILYLFFARFIGKKNYFILKDDKVILEFKKSIELKCIDMGSYSTIKALHGYSIYIYKIGKVQPEIEFNIESIHQLNALKEFFRYKNVKKLNFK